MNWATRTDDPPNLVFPSAAPAKRVKVRATPITVGDRTISFCVKGCAVQAGEVVEVDQADAVGLVARGKATFATSTH